MKKAGTLLILLALFSWIAVLFLNKFTLTPEIIDQQLTTDHKELLAPKLQPLIDKPDQNVFAFAGSIKTAIEAVTKELESEGRGGEKIFDKIIE